MQALSSKQRFLKNYLSFSIGVWVNAFVLFFSIPIISWLMTPEEYGKANMFLTVYSVALFVVILGTPNALMRFYHKVEDHGKLLWSCLIVPVILSLILAMLAFAFKRQLNLFLVERESSSVHMLLVVSIFIGVLQTFNQTLIRMQGNGIVYSALQIVNSVSNTGFVVFYALLVQKNFYALIYGQILATLITFTVGVYFQQKYWFPIKIEKSLVKEILAYSYPFLFSNLVWWLLSWTDRIVLRMYTDFNQIGLYSAALRLMSAPSLFTTGFSTLWQPFAYELYEKNPEKREIFAKVFDYVSFLILMVALMIICLKDAFFLLFAHSYRRASYVVPFLLLNPVAFTMAIVVARGIEFVKKTYWFIISDGVAAVFNLIGNMLLIPVLGAKGAALSTGLSYIIVFSIESTASIRLYPVNYKLTRAYVSLGIFSAVAAINTFVEKATTGVLSSLVGLVLVAFLYRDILKAVSNDLFNAWMTIGHNRSTK